MATYYNPAAAVNECRRKGLETPGEVYECAVGKAPASARDLWYREARRLVKSMPLGRAGRRRRRKGRR